MVISELESRVAAVVVDAEDVETTAQGRAAGVAFAMQALHEAGFALLLVDAATEVIVRRVNSRRRRWWRGRSK